VVRDLGIQVAYFAPHIVPETVPLYDGSPSPIIRYGFFNNLSSETHLFYGLPRTPSIEMGTNNAVAWLAHNVPPGTRALVDNGQIGERAAWKTPVEVIGGFELRNIAHAQANYFRRYRDGQVDERELAAYLRTFAIGIVMVQKPRLDFERAKHVLEELPLITGRKVYRPRFPVSVVQRGGGTVHASTNRIAMTGSDPGQDVVLAYHWHEKLRCIPQCRVLREPVALDRVGFIRVPAPHPPGFVVRLEY